MEIKNVFLFCSKKNKINHIDLKSMFFLPSHLTIAVINFYTWRGQCNVRHLVSNPVKVLLTSSYSLFLNVLHLNSAPETRPTVGG